LFDIVGVGDSSVDLAIAVDRIATHDEKVRGRLEGKFPGGIIANFCCAAARFGARTGIITAVGDDEFGELSIGDLKKFGVDLSCTVVKSGVETYFCVIYLDDSGEKALTIVETDALMPAVQDISFDYLKRARFIHMNSLDLDLARFIVSNSSDLPGQLSIDVEPTAAGGGLEDWSQILEKMDIVFINEQAIRQFLSDDLFSSGRELVRLGPEIVAVTCGAQGVHVFTREESFRVAGHSVPVKDTTGAGDCFNAIFLSCLSRGFDLRRATEYANAAAAISVGSVGARSGLPTEQQVSAFLARV
jgi:ribokinase